VLILSLLVISISVLCLATVVAFYPLSLWLVSLVRKEQRKTPGVPVFPTVSVLVAVRNGENLIAGKIENALSCRYPKDKLEVVVYSDGSEDRTEEVARTVARRFERVRCFGSSKHQGKMHALNEAFIRSTGEILVFTDADAVLHPLAAERLVSHFADPRIGGVCGQRTIGKDDAALKEAQSTYISFDSRIKRLESRLGSITSNDGKVYAVRRELFQPIPPGVTDDLYVALCVVERGQRFVFDPEVLAFIHVPSRETTHELSRRRRIVSRSLRGIHMKRRLLNPLRFGFFSIGLFINKVLRRLIPVCLIAILLSSAVLYAVTRETLALLLLAAQVGLYGLGLVRSLVKGPARRLCSVIYYFTIGGYGTLLGIADFLLHRVVSKWDPTKAQ